MKKNWQDYIDKNGDFELPSYLYRLNNDLMKETLDLGVLLSQDNQKLRAYKEQVKKTFKKRWLELAQALEFFDLIIPCVCRANDFCEICGGSRYVLHSAISPDQLREVAVVFGVEQDVALAEKLQKGLMKALKDVEHIDMQSLQ
jgi:hypothetical protein